MKINIQDLPKVLTAWVDEVLMPKSTLVQKGFITFILLQGQNRINEAMEPLKLLADKDGSFEVNELYQNLLKALEAMGGKYTIPVLNYVFDKADLDMMFEIIKKEFAK